MNVVDILTGLRDVEGIIGSFVVNEDGQLVGRDLPSVFDDDTLLGVAPRLVRLRDGVAGDSPDPAAFVLRYAEHKVHIRAAGSGVLCVLSESRVNTPALRVGMKLVARRVASIVAQAPATPVPSSAPPVTQRSRATPHSPAAPAPSHAAPPPPPSTATSGMIYRGQKVRG